MFRGDPQCLSVLGYRLGRIALGLQETPPRVMPIGARGRLCLTLLELTLNLINPAFTNHRGDVVHCDLPWFDDPL